MTARVLRQVWIVTRKELTDSLRDRRALWSILFSVLFGPIVVVFMVNRVADRERQADAVRLPIVGMEHAPALVEWLRQQQGVTVVAGPDDPEQAVRDEDEDVVLVITPEYAARFRASRPAEVRLVADGARSLARPTVQRVRTLLQGYSSQIATLRLVGRGVSPAIVTPLRVEDVEVSTSRQRAAAILNMIGLFMLLATLSGGMQIATDSTAGERERGSLEPLLVNPVPRGALVAGKWLAATCGAVVSVVLTAVFCGIAFQRYLLPKMNVAGFAFTPEFVAQLLAAVLPLCALAAALQACIGTMARSFKEAQSYMAILISVPAVLVAVVGALYTLTNQPWMYAVPMLSQYALLTALLGGRAPGVMPFVISALTTLAAAALLVRLTTSLFRSERIIFAR